MSADFRITSARDLTIVDGTVQTAGSAVEVTQRIVTRVAREKRLQFIIEKILGVLQERCKSIVPAFVQKIIRILALRQTHELHLHPAFQKDLKPAQGRGLARFVAVVNHDHFFHKTPHEAHVVLAERCTKRRHGIPEAMLVKSEKIHIAFHQNQIRPFPIDMFFGEIQTEEFAAFRKDRRFG